jgi:DNA-binding CsgD family transcriptional regulator
MEELSEEIVIKHISTLTNREKQVFRKMCFGDTYQEIANKHNVNIETIKSQSKAIYKKLDLKKYKNSVKRRKILHEIYCPQIDRQDIVTAPEPIPETQEIVIIPISEEELFDKMVDDDDGKISLPLVIDMDNKFTPIHNKFNPPRRRGLPIWVQILLLILAGVGLWELVTSVFSLNSENSVVEKEVTVVVLATDDPNQLTQSAEIQQVVVTETPDLQVPISEESGLEGLQFFDDFEFGVDPKWSIQYGDLGSSKGSFTVISPFESSAGLSHFAILEPDELKNYIATLALSEYHASSNDSKFGMILRYSPEGESIGILFDPRKNKVSLGYFDNAQNWNIFPGTTVTENFDKTTVFKAEVDGNLYKVFSDSSLITYANMPGIESGKFGLWFVSSSNTDIYSYAPRVEYIRIDVLD